MARTVFPLDPDNATGALMEACAAAGLDPTDAELIRLGESAVFRLRSSPAVVRVGRSSSRLKEAEREVADRSPFEPAGTGGGRQVEQLVALTLYGPRDYAVLGYKPQPADRA